MNSSDMFFYCINVLVLCVFFNGWNNKYNWVLFVYECVYGRWDLIILKSFLV